MWLSQSYFYRAKSQVIWDHTQPTPRHSRGIWKNIQKPKKNYYSPPSRENTHQDLEEKRGNASPNRLEWKLINVEDKISIPKPENKTRLNFSAPSNIDELKILLSSIPLKRSDYQPMLNLSFAVPTASALKEEEWNIDISMLSPFKSASGTGNQNYSIRVDYGFSDQLLLSGFYSEADDPLNKPIKNLDVRPANLWEAFGVAARLRLVDKETLKVAVIGSIERWTVGSGGSDSLVKNSADKTSPNMFNDSGKRVETQNLIGSLTIPFTWNATKKLQFTLTPGVGFLPPNQGSGQGGSGEFYGTNLYLGGGFLWQPKPQIGLTGSIAQPLGSGTNNFDNNLNFSRVPIISAGINWHLNPRITLQGQLTNGFGATPATALLTLPSDNRLSYNAKFVFSGDAPDTPQPPLTTRQDSLSRGGLTVNTALVPPDTTNIVKASTDIQGNLETSYGISISNILQLDLSRSISNNVPQTTAQARTYLNDGAVNWRGSGKAVVTSPLRGEPIWSALRISLGRNMDLANNTGQGYLFAETPLTWEANSKFAFNINPKVAWSGVGNVWGIGISANIQLTPDLELLPEANIVFSDQKESNSTLALRWNVNDKISIDSYLSTASSIEDIGQLLNANQTRYGIRSIIKF